MQRRKGFSEGLSSEESARCPHSLISIFERFWCSQMMIVALCISCAFKVGSWHFNLNLLTLQRNSKRFRGFSSAVSKTTIWSTKIMGTHWQGKQTQFNGQHYTCWWFNTVRLQNICTYIDNKVLAPCVFMGPSLERIKKSTSTIMLLDSRTSIHAMRTNSLCITLMWVPVHFRRRHNFACPISLYICGYGATKGLDQPWMIMVYM